MNDNSHGSRSRLPRWTCLALVGASMFVPASAMAEFYTGADPFGDGGAAYATQCQSRGVPLPPPLNSGLWQGKTNKLLRGTSIEGGPTNFGPNGFGTTGYVLYASTSAGLCAAYVNFHNKNSSGAVDNANPRFVNVICQATSGKTCMWEWVGSPQGSIPFTFEPESTPNGNGDTYFCNTPNNVDPATGRWRFNDGQFCPTSANLNSPMVNGVNPIIASTNAADFNGNCNQGANAGTGKGCIAAFTPAGSGTGGSPNGICTSCHTGENMFINPHLSGTHRATDLLRRGLVTADKWFPTSWPDPIVYPNINASSFNPPTPTNFGPLDTAGYPASTSGCLSCHNNTLPRTDSNYGGRLPALSSENRNPGGEGERFCDELQTITSMPGSQGGMPPTSTCNPALNNCPSQIDPFVIRLLWQTCSRVTRVNLAYGKTALVSSSYTGGSLQTAGMLATDGVVDGNFFHGTVFHTLGNDSLQPNTASTPSWSNAGKTLKNAFGTLVANGGTIYGIENYTNPPFATVQKFFPTGGWSSTNGAVGEISISSVNNVVWAATPGFTTFKYLPGAPGWNQVTTTSFSHLAAGNGTNAWGISADGKTVYRHDGTNFQVVLSQPWVTHSPYASSDTLQGIAVGSDEDVWLWDSRGNVYHTNGGGSANVSGNYAWEMNTPTFASSTAVVTRIVAANAYNVWAIGSSPLGLFNFNGASNKTCLSTNTCWQHHCPSGGCTTTNSNYTALSVSSSDGAVWVLTGAGVPYQVDQSKVIDRNNNTINDDSLIQMTGPANLKQIVAGGGSAGMQANVMGIDSSGASHVASNYRGVPPMPGGAYWYVDLGGFYQVDQVKIFNRTDGSGERLSKFRINYWNGFAWALGSDQSNTTIAATTQVLPVPVNFKTQYVMIQKPTAGVNGNLDYLNLAEVQVWGPPTAVTQY